MQTLGHQINPMQPAVKLSRTKAELFKQKDAFYLYKLVGIEKASVFYPEYKDFLLANSEKSLEEIEELINLKIRQASLYAIF